MNVESNSKKGRTLNLYNEHDPFAAQWLRNLMYAGHIPKGTVDARSIKDLKPADVAGAGQRHFFAGIGVWSHALRLAGWPDDRPVWTGSCPCQPFSVAGRGLGIDDPRHLWPVWFELIKQCRPPVVFGEQVASADGLAWLDAVRADLEGAGYAVGAADLCAAGVGAPHIRQRLYFVGIRLADAREGGRGWGANVGRDERNREDGGRPEGVGVAESRGAARGMAVGIRLADDGCEGRRQIGSDVRGSSEGSRAQGVDERSLYSGALSSRGLAHHDERGQQQQRPSRVHEEGPPGNDTHGRGAARGLGNNLGAGLEGHGGHGDDGHQPGRDRAQPHGPTPTAGFWSNPDWVACRDGKQRPVEPGSFPLAHGAPARVGRLRAYGNAIVSEVAATFIKAVMEHLKAEKEPPR